jgi:hypothetical protein
MRMASAAFARDAGKLRFGNADRSTHQSSTLMGPLVVGGAIGRHWIPFVRSSLERTLSGPVVTQGRKEEVYGRVTFSEAIRSGEDQSSR